MKHSICNYFARRCGGGEAPVMWRRCVEDSICSHDTQEPNRHATQHNARTLMQPQEITARCCYRRIEKPCISALKPLS